MGGTSRGRALALKAANVAEVVAVSGLSRLYETLTAAQRQQLQRYLDAQVVDPVVRQEAEALLAKGTKYYGSLVVVDPVLARRSERKMKEYIWVGKMDDRTRLNLDKLLASDALSPVTDNPDEAAYLDRVRQILDKRGVWLRLAQKMVRDADDPSRWMRDPRHFEVWLSLGPEGDAIPIKSGRLDRAALLGCTALGAGYYTAVDNGPVEKALEREIKRLSDHIDQGMELHQMIARIRREAAFGVVEVSDTLGRASFPDYEMWLDAHKLLIRAMELRNQGKIYGCRAFLVTAALFTRNCATLLNTYIDKTTSGAERSVKVLKVARTAGQVAEVALTVTGAGALAARGVNALRGAAASRAATAAGDAAIDRLAEREIAKYIERNPEIAGELNQVRVVPGPKGSVPRRGRGPSRHEIGDGGFVKW